MKNQLIKCPYCNWEYFPGELFTPDAFIGQPKNIERDSDGSIIYAQNTEQCLTETYVCDGCNRKFNINASISFSSSKPAILEDTYCSEKYPGAKLTLFED